MSPPLNAPAPDVDLEGWADGAARRFRLSEQRGTPVVLAFYPGDDTPVCTKQLCSYQDDLDLLRGVGAQVWGISTQDVASHQRFAEKRGLQFPLLADVDKQAHRAYDVQGRLGLTKRAVFVVDGAGLLRWAHASQLGLTYQDTDTIVAVLKGL